MEHNLLEWVIGRDSRGLGATALQWGSVWLGELLAFPADPTSQPQPSHREPGDAPQAAGTAEECRGATWMADVMADAEGLMVNGKLMMAINGWYDWEMLAIMIHAVQSWSSWLMVFHHDKSWLPVANGKRGREGPQDGLANGSLMVSC